MVIEQRVKAQVKKENILSKANILDYIKANSKHIDLRLDSLDNLKIENKNENSYYAEITINNKTKIVIIKMIELSNDITNNDELDTEDKISQKNFLEFKFAKNTKNIFSNKSIGYYIFSNRTIFIIYENSVSLSFYIKSNRLDFASKVKVVKNIIEIIRNFYLQNIKNFELNTNTFRFLESNSSLVYCGSNINQANKCEIYNLGYIMGCLFSNNINFEYESLKEIRDEYVKAIIIGILREKESERPKLYQIIEIYNLYVKKKKLDLVIEDDINFNSNIFN